MNDSVHYFSHTVTKKFEGSYGKKRRLAIAMYFIGPLAVLTLMLATIGAGAFIWFVPLCPTVMAIVVKVVNHRFFSVEYRYTISKSELIVEEQSGSRSKKLAALRISDAELIQPYGSNKEMVDSLDVKARIEAVSTMTSPDVYAIYCPSEEGATLIFINAPEKTVKLLYHYNKCTVLA
jgi:hypothetical protein